MKSTVIVLSLVTVLAASSSPFAAPEAPVPDTNLGLSKGSVFDVATPPAVKLNPTSPGEQPLLPRVYVIAPPRIPHGIADFVPITQKQNACIDCHAVAQKKPGEATPLPASHYTDLRLAPDVVGAPVVGARYVCVSCHVPTTDARDLVQNRFKP
jgi:nitrate reductase (cytochrome), electron transfer subunit